MARDALTVVEVNSKDGADSGALSLFTLVLANGASFPSENRESVFLQNDNAGAAVVTFSVNAVRGRTNDYTISMAAGEQRIVPAGALAPDLFKQPSGADIGLVYVDVDVSDVKIAVVRGPA